MDYHWSSSEI